MTAIKVEQLLRMADAARPFLLLDVRNDEEYEAWRIEARHPIKTVHIPYFDLIEDPDLIKTVPNEGGETFVLCAKGGSSDMIAEMCREAGLDARNIEGGMVEYGRYFDPVPIPLEKDEAERFEIWQLNRRGKGCLSYVVRSGEDAVVVDPSRQIEAYEDFVAGLGARIVYVFDTHVHADHISGGPVLASRTGASYFVAAGDGFDLTHPVAQFRDGQDLQLGGEGGVVLNVRILHTPGHTPGSISFLVGRSHLLTGDTIFVASVGRPDLGGQVVEWGRMLFHTLRERISVLPDDTIILPAHYSGLAEMRDDGVVAGRLGDLRRDVPELQIQTEEEFVDAMKKTLSPPPETYAKIIRVNLGEASIDDEQATEWELGKNQCAASGR